jgi:hypothetical protein
MDTLVGLYTSPLGLPFVVVGGAAGYFIVPRVIPVSPVVGGVAGAALLPMVWFGLLGELIAQADGGGHG